MISSITSGLYYWNEVAKVNFKNLVTYREEENR